MNTLRELVAKIQYDSSWGIWAATLFTPDSEARYGQRQFENGGVLDDKEFFADGVQIGDFLANDASFAAEQTEEGEEFEEDRDAAACFLIAEIEQERQEAEADHAA